MADPTIAQRSPFRFDVTKGKSYWWCACGRSQKQPFCDGSHKGSEFAPMKYDAAKSEKLWFCACKATGKAPLCDGSHKKLP